jgi:hypothetical protein
MKRTISLWLGLLAFALVPVLAQTPAAPAIKGPTGSIHGTITGPEGAPRTSGSVSLSTDDGHTNKFTFQVSSSGDYEGTAAPGTYKVVYRAADTPPDSSSTPSTKLRSWPARMCFRTSICPAKNCRQAAGRAAKAVGGAQEAQR